MKPDDGTDGDDEKTYNDIRVGENFDDLNNERGVHKMDSAHRINALLHQELRACSNKDADDK